MKITNVYQPVAHSVLIRSRKILNISLKRGEREKKAKILSYKNLNS